MNRDLESVSSDLNGFQSLVQMVKDNRSLIVDGCLALLAGEAILCGIFVFILTVFSLGS